MIHIIVLSVKPARKEVPDAPPAPNLPRAGSRFSRSVVYRLRIFEYCAGGFGLGMVTKSSQLAASSPVVEASAAGAFLTCGV